MYYAVIMAGGSGTRLWPFSRRGRPKQVLALMDERSLFNHAVDRLLPLFPTERILVVTRAEHVAALRALAPELPPENFVIESEGRGTAPAIGLAATVLQQRDPTAVMAVVTSDHYIERMDRFRAVLVAAEEVAQVGYLVTLGIAPTSPSTGFGYIRHGAQAMSAGQFSVIHIEQFTEKPSEKEASAFVESGEYSWNSGMFVWRVDRILSEIERQMPELHEALAQIGPRLRAPDGNADALSDLWSRIPKQTIDYGIMEHAENAVIIPVDIGWMDVGNWANLSELLATDLDCNSVFGGHVGIDTHRSLIFSDRPQHLVATLGIEGLVIVATDDVTLVCSKNRAEEVRELVARLEHTQRDTWL